MPVIQEEEMEEERPEPQPGQPGGVEEDAAAHAPEPAPAPDVLQGPAIAAPLGVTVSVGLGPNRPRCLVKFDNPSHASGIQRAYIECPWGHEGCYRYRQVNLTPNYDDMVALLYTWAIQGEGKTKEQHRDEVQPTLAEVSDMKLALYGRR
jgi:hypothetical protein